MKDNQRNHCNRNCQKPRAFDAAAMVADISINVDAVNIPRKEYDELLYCSVLVDILNLVYTTSGKYAAGDLLESIFKDDEKEEE